MNSTPDKKNARRVWKKMMLCFLAPPVAIGLFYVVGGPFIVFPPQSLLIPSVEHGVAYWSTNPDYLKPFFGRAVVPSPPYARVTQEKAAGVRRVVMLGESAAAGFPVADFNLARLIQVEWNRRHPDERVEVINLATVAVNSHILRLMALEVLQLNPDLIILYAGHNEVIGPFGPASTFGLPGKSIETIRAQMYLRNTRIGQAIVALLRVFKPASTRPGEAWQGLNEFKDVQFTQDDPRLLPMYQHADINIREIAGIAREHGAACLIAIPAMNLNDWEPSGSEVEDAEREDVIASLRAGELERHRSALLVYRAAQIMHASEGIQAAWPLFRRACDLDTRRLRIDSRLQDQMRNIAADPGRVMVVDVDRWMHERHPGFFSDRQYFLEHVHLTFEGRAAVATRLVDGMTALWKGTPMDESPEAAAAWWNQMGEQSKELARRTLFTGYDEHDMWSMAWKLLRLEVFQSAEGMEARRSQLASHVIYLQNRAKLDWGPERIREAADEAVALNPDDPLVYFAAGRLLGITGQFDEADAMFRRGFALMPAHPESWLNYGMLSLARGNTDGAREALRVLEKNNHTNPGMDVLRQTLASPSP